MIRTHDMEEFRAGLEKAREHQDGPVMVHVETDPLVPSPDSESWWDVPVSEVSTLDTTTDARRRYEEHKAQQRLHL